MVRDAKAFKRQCRRRACPCLQTGPRRHSRHDAGSPCPGRWRAAGFRRARETPGFTGAPRRTCRHVGAPLRSASCAVGNRRSVGQQAPGPIGGTVKARYPPERNYIVVIMMPKPDLDTGCLLPGVHEASWDEAVSRFGGISHRERLLDGLQRACRGLAAAGRGDVLPDGSFVTTKAMPGDYDAAWGTKGVNPDLLDPVLLDMKHPRAAMKAKFLGDLFPDSASAASGVLFRDFNSRAIATASGRASCR